MKMMRTVVLLSSFLALSACQKEKKETREVAHKEEGVEVAQAPDQASSEASDEEVQEATAPLEKNEWDAGLLEIVPEEVEFLVTTRNMGEKGKKAFNWMIENNIFLEVKDQIFEEKEEGEEGGEQEEGVEDKVENDLKIAEEEENEAEKLEEEKRAEKALMTMAKAAGNENFICLLDGGSTKGAFLSEMFVEYYKMSTRVYPVMIKKALSDDFAFSDIEGLQEELLGDFLKDLKESLSKEGLLQMPNIMIGIRGEDEKELATAYRELSAQIKKGYLEHVEENPEELGNMGEMVEFEKEGVKFLGWKLRKEGNLKEFFGESNEKIRESLEESMRELKEELGEGLDFDSILNEQRVFEIFIGMGLRGDTVIFFVGENEDAIRLAPSVEQSIVARDDTKWWQEYGGRDVVAHTYTSEPFLNAFQGLINPMPLWEEVRKTLAIGQDEWIHGLKLMELLSDLAQLEKTKQKMIVSANSEVYYLDQGLKCDGRGGYRHPDTDYETPWLIQGSDQQNPFLRLQWKTKGKGSELSRKQWGLVGELLAVTTDEVLEKSLKKMDDIAEFQEKVETFVNKELKPSLASAVEGFSKGYLEGVEDEMLLMIDLNGGMPTIPLIPELYTKEGRVPRLLICQPSKNREKLGFAWLKWEESLQRMTSAISEISGRPLSLPGVVTASNEDLISHFISLPTTTPDCLPCVSVSDRFFAVGSSKKYAEDFYHSIDWDRDESSRGRGIALDLDVRQLIDFLEHWLKLAEKQNELDSERGDLKEDFFLEEEDEEEDVEEGILKEFTDELGFGDQIEERHLMKAIDELKKFGKFRYRGSLEEDELRYSIHLEFKN